MSEKDELIVRKNALVIASKKTEKAIAENKERLDKEVKANKDKKIELEAALNDIEIDLALLNVKEGCASARVYVTAEVAFTIRVPIMTYIEEEEGGGEEVDDDAMNDLGILMAKKIMKKILDKADEELGTELEDLSCEVDFNDF